jgi:hypothetical protein
LRAAGSGSHRCTVNEEGYQFDYQETYLFYIWEIIFLLTFNYTNTNNDWHLIIWQLFCISCLPQIAITSLMKMFTAGEETCDCGVLPSANSSLLFLHFS